MLGLSVITHLHKMLNSITLQYIVLTTSQDNPQSFIQIKVQFIIWHVFGQNINIYGYILCLDMQKSVFIFYYYISCWSLKSNMKDIVNRKRPRRLCILSFKMQCHSLKKFMILHPRMYKAFVNFAENELNFLYFACLRAVIKQSYDSNIFMTKEPLFLNGI